MKKATMPKPISDKFLRAYLEAALWSSTDDEGENLDKNYSIEDFSNEALEEAIHDTNSFIVANEADLAQAGDDGQNGHDFWLTRERHGAGFWDRGYLDKDVAKRLTDAAHAYGEGNIYVGDDGKIYFG